MTSMRKVELVGGPADGKRLSIPIRDRQIVIPGRDGSLAYAQRRGDGRMFDYRPDVR